MFVELGPQQISLLDLLRLLRQRRKTDEEANTFVAQQLKRAEAVATQVRCVPDGLRVWTAGVDP